MSDFVKKQFDAVARDYDRQRRQLIPCFDDFYGMAAAWVNCDNDAPHILDLGAGTGLFSSFIRSKYPKATLTLIDLSEEMLKEARQRFGDDQAVNYITADYAAYPFQQQFDAVISSLSIHHLPHPDKKTLFRKVHDLLIKGGTFVNADQAAGTTTFIDNYYMTQWEDAIRQSGLAAEAIEASIERRKIDLNATVHNQLEWMREAGFSDADCIYKHNGFAVFAALKN